MVIINVEHILKNSAGGVYPKLMGVAWHNKWENFGLITSAEGLVRELVAYDKIPLVSNI